MEFVETAADVHHFTTLITENLIKGFESLEFGILKNKIKRLKVSINRLPAEMNPINPFR